MDQGRDWAASCAQTTGRCVADYRAELKISAQQLADRCQELGMPSLSRAVITKLENGRREAVSTAELQVLAMALGVPAVVLLFPLGRVETVEVLPGRHVDPYAAMEWFIGNSEDPADPNAMPQMNIDNPIILWNEALRCDGLLPVLQRELAAAQERARATAFETVPAGAHDPIEDELGRLTQHVQMTKSALRRVRAGIRALGMTPPVLTPETARILGEAQEGPLEPWREQGRREWLAAQEDTPERKDAQ
jgi:transcriptional regulator with XRE-family HTH domain